ncbi:hypothetical protein ACFVUY_11455 [Kitasatospora sp. NPDC058063]|uniref:hypothetical protein n=1 Tax=unclassified Kitasatospora TaxID=2633591 RepID=UPI0036DBA8AB
MGRTAWATGRAAVLALVLGAAACTGQGGGDWGDGGLPSPTVVVRPAPAGHGVVLSPAAPASAQWIVDSLALPGASPEACPVPALTDMVVLDNGIGRSHAAAVWLGDGEVECLATIRKGDGVTKVVIGTSLDSLADQPVPIWLGGWAIFTVFPGDARKVVIKGDDDHVFGPLHQRFVDFGGGRELTIVEYAYLPEGPESEKSIPSARAQVCPSGTGPADTASCRPARWLGRPPAPTPSRPPGSA